MIEFNGSNPNKHYESMSETPPGYHRPGGGYNLGMTEWIGKMLGKVRIDSLLARGGMAEVYLGEHVALQREVAVKILRAQYEDDPQLLERFQREARVVAKLRHPNIVQVFDFDTIENHPYLVMEYVPGLSLSRYLHVLHGRNGRLELPIVSRIITQVASALQYAHEAGVIHRDVKPGNILLTSRSSKVVAGKPLPGDFEPILTDFGLVRFLNSTRQTVTGVIAGTPAYMSPEQARGEPTDERTDIYSLGIVLYELLSGHVPFDGETTMAVILKQITESHPLIPGLSEPMQRVLMHALAKKPDERFQTPNDLADAFNATLHETTDAATVMESDPKVTTRITKVGYRSPKKRTRLLPALIAGFTAVILGGFLLFRGYALPPSIPTEPIHPTQSPTITSQPTPETPPALLPLGPTGVLHFQDGVSILDQAALTALAMPIPPNGTHYEIWLVNETERYSLGVLALDMNGKGEQISTNASGNNFVALYDQVEITIELDTDTDPAPSGIVAYSSTLPQEGLTHIRHLLHSFAGAPDEMALAQGLKTDIDLLVKFANDMQESQQAGDEARLRQSAEAILNLLVGSKSEDHKDWDGDGQTMDPGDGFGLLLNGNNPGYIQAVYSHSDYAVISPGATQNMVVHGQEVKACAQNLAERVSQMRELVLDILDSTPNSDLSKPVADSVFLAEQLQNGIDLDGDKTIEPIVGECGIISLLQSAYSMADMSLLPVDFVFAEGTVTGTATPTGATFAPARTSVRSTNTPGNPTVKPPNTHKPPTNTPKPKKN